MALSGSFFTAVNGAATLSDAVDGDVASYTGASSSIDAGDGNAANLQLNISADAGWAMLFTVKMLCTEALLEAYFEGCAT